jgi:ABC-type antimicrobial peptide transport system permease subunit
VHAFSGFGDVEPRLLVDNDTASRLYGQLSFDRLSVANVSSAELLAWFDERPGGRPRVQQRDSMRTVALEIFDRTFAITNALTSLALLVAVMGLYNAITALKLNQLATSDLLDALGLSRGEKRRIDLLRGVSIGAFAVLLALPLGVVMGAVLCQVINPRAFGWSIDLQLSVPAMLWPLGLGIAAAVFAGLVPTPKERLGNG